MLVRDAEDRIAPQRVAARAVARLARLARQHDQLGQQRIVVDRDLAPLDDAAVDANARARRLAVEQQRAGLRQEAVRGILGVDAALDGVAALRRARPAPRQRLAGGDDAAARCTRSTPVTHSVTGCSTCSRVFISRK